MAKAVDLTMLGMLTGRERTAAEWTELFSRAGWNLQRIVPSPTPMSVLEVVG